MLDNTKGAIKNGQSRETGTIGHTRQKKTNTICVGYHYTQMWAKISSCEKSFPRNNFLWYKFW